MTPPPERVLWINAGGTIVDKGYPDPYNAPDTVEPLPLEQSFALVMNTIRELGLDHRIDGFTFGLERFAKDSKKYTPDDIEALADIIKNTHHRLVLITHGTDFMAVNGEALQKALRGTDKTVVFAGAMVPLIMKNQYPGDAGHNLTKALTEIDRLPPGVYVTGRHADTRRMDCFDPSLVEKDFADSKKNLQLTFRERTQKDSAPAIEKR